MTIEPYHPVFSPEEEAIVDAEYQSLRNAYLGSNHRKKVDIIDQAFNLARVAHAGVRRRSGEPYILHPIAVARIVCSELGLGSTSICCALMHDVVEDTDYTVEDIEALFGPKISKIIDGLTKISSDALAGKQSQQAESIRKLLLTMSDDARVVIIKLADRLHNMRTLGSMLPAKRLKIAGETLSIYAPLAHRFGLYTVKTELEDLSFKYEHPDSYAYISAQVAMSEDGRQDLFKRFAEPIDQELRALGIRYEMRTRVKTNYSIWRKMQTQGISFSEVYDLFAVRIVFDTEDKSPSLEKVLCYDIADVIRRHYKANPARNRDWVSTPKPNGYQAIHLTVQGPDKQWIEVQIRSRRMDEFAEQGLAAHWRYKDGPVEEDKVLEKWIGTVREIVKNPSPDAMDFMDNFYLSLNTDEVVVYTPRGDEYVFPIGATVLDMAYAIHSELGDHCIGAKIRHQVVPASTVLPNGEIVEILDSQMVNVKPEWLNLIRTAKARMAISAALRRQQREQATEGEDILRRHLSELSLEMTTSVVDRLKNFYRYAKRDDFYRAIASGKANLTLLTQALKGEEESKGFLSMLRIPFGRKRKPAPVVPEPVMPHEGSRPIDKKELYQLTETNGMLNYVVAPCCKPIPGDNVLGTLINDDTEVEVHRVECPTAMRIRSLRGDSLISTVWGAHPSYRFEATLTFRGVDAHGILYSMAQTLTEDFKVSISRIHIETTDGLFDGYIVVSVGSTADVDRICQLLVRNNNSILSIGRPTLFRD